MARFWIGIGLLAVFLTLGIGVTVAMEDIHEPMAELLEEAAEEALEGDMREASALADQAQRRWERFRKGTASVADHAPMDEIEGLFAQVQTFARAGRAEDFAAGCARLSSLVRAMSEAHGLGWWNLLCTVG